MALYSFDDRLESYSATLFVILVQVCALKGPYFAVLACVTFFVCKHVVLVFAICRGLGGLRELRYELHSPNYAALLMEGLCFLGLNLGFCAIPCVDFCGPPCEVICV